MMGVSSIFLSLTIIFVVLATACQSEKKMKFRSQQFQKNNKNVQSGN